MGNPWSRNILSLLLLVPFLPLAGCEAQESGEVTPTVTPARDEAD